MAGLRGVGYALISFAIFATHDVVIKKLGGIYAPFQLIFFAVLLSFPLVTIMMMRDTTPGHLRPVHPWWIAVRTGAGVIGGMSAFYAFSVLPLTETYAILFASPLIITILAIPVLGEQVRIRRWLAVIVGLAGVMIVLRPGSDGTGLGLGHLAALTAATFSALASIIVRKVGHEERSVVLLLYPMLGNFAVMACIMPFFYIPMPIEHIGMVGLISLFGFTAGWFLIAAYKNSEAAIVAPMQYSQIIWATGFGYFLFDEMIDRQTMIGASIIIASGLYIVLRESRGATSTNRPVLQTRSRYESGSTFRIGPLLRKALQPR